MTYTIALIIAGGIAPRIIGSLWYHPRVFGGRWLALSGHSPELAEKAQRMRPITSFVSLAAGLAMSTALSMIFSTLNLQSTNAVIGMATLLWAGIVVPVTLGEILWQHKSASVYAIDLGYWLVSVIVISMIVGIRYV